MCNRNSAYIKLFISWSQGTRPLGTSTPIFQQQPQSTGVFELYQQQSAQQLTINNPAAVPGGSGTAAHNASSGSIGQLVRDYSETDLPTSLAQMNTPTHMEEEDKDDQ